MNKNTSPQKEITLQDLAKIMADSFDKSEKETDRKIDALALMVAKGFDDISGKITHMDTKIDTLDQRIDTMDGRIDGIDERLERIEGALETLEANLNKKVDKIDHNTLTYRVEKLEKKFA